MQRTCDHGSSTYARGVLFVNMSLFALGLSACGENPQGEGPMERSGKAIDKAAEKTGEAIGDGVQAVDDKLHESP